MSLFSVQARKQTTYYDHLLSTSRTPGKERLADRKSTEGMTQGKGERTSGESVCDESKSSDKSRSINRTYVISAMSKSGGGGGGGGGPPHTPYRGRLTLQRRSRRKTGAEAADKTVSDSSQNCTPAVPEKRLTLQRRTRTRTPSMDKGVGRQREVSGTDPQQTPKVLSEPNGRTPVLIRSMSLKSDPRGKDKAATSHGKPASSKTPSRCPSSAHRQLLEEQAQTFKTPTKKTPFEKIAAKRDVFEKLAQKEAPRPAVVRSASLQRGAKSRLQVVEKTPVPAPRTTSKAACTGVQRPLVAKTSTSSGLKVEATQASSRTSSQSSAAPAATEQQSSRTTEALRVHDSFKMENSAVTVAVRVRPFNARLVLCQGVLILLVCNVESTDIVSSAKHDSFSTVQTVQTPFGICLCF